MGTNQEFFRIQQWIADWYCTSVEDCKYSREDIRDICRGPMREVLLDFILPRFRPDEQIKVIRSNLYLNDILQKNAPDDEGKDVISQQDRQIKELKSSIEKLQQEKLDIVSRIAKSGSKMNDTRMSLQRIVAENLATFENLDARAHFVRDRVRSTNALLEDLNQIKPSIESGTSNVATTTNDPSANSVSPQTTRLKSLSTNAMDLFNLIFLPSSNVNASQLNSPEIQNHTTAVSTQISELTQSGLSPSTVEKWANKEQEKFSGQIKHAAVKYSNVMSPVEELSTEADALHVRLMKAHVGIHFKYRELHRCYQELKAENTNKIQSSILSDQFVVPANLLSYIQKEEEHGKLVKCRELMDKFRKLDGSNSPDTDLLALICEDFVDGSVESGEKYQQQLAENGMFSRSSSRGSFGPENGNNYSVKQETLEDLTVALLKSYPQSRQQLDSTIKQCKKLVLERFPKIFLTDQNGGSFSRITSANGEHVSHPIEYQIKIPQHLLLNKDATATPCIFQEQDELVSEVTRLQSELEKNRLQCEVMCQGKEPRLV